MNSIQRFLVKTGMIRISTTWLKRKMVREELNAIEFALAHGLYHIREMAAKHLGEIQAESSKDKVIQAINDPVPTVSEAAMKAVEKIGVDDQLAEKIAQKRLYWKQVEQEKKTKGRSTEKKYMPERKDRPSRKSYENLKQMLRKPMNSGKWF